MRIPAIFCLSISTLLQSCSWFSSVDTESSKELSREEQIAEDKKKLSSLSHVYRQRQSNPSAQTTKKFEFKTNRQKMLQKEQMRRDDFEYLEKEAKKNNAEACYELGISYKYGLYGRADLKKAYHWLKIAGALGHVQAKRTLRHMSARY